MRVDQRISTIKAVEMQVFVHLRNTYNHVNEVRKVRETRDEDCRAK